MNEIKNEIKDFLELNKMKIHYNKIFGSTLKVVLQGKLIALNAYTKNLRRSTNKQLNDVTLGFGKTRTNQT